MMQNAGSMERARRLAAVTAINDGRLQGCRTRRTSDVWLLVEMQHDTTAHLGDDQPSLGRVSFRT